MRLVPTLLASTLGIALFSSAACGDGGRDDGFGEGTDADVPGTSSGSSPTTDSGTGFDPVDADISPVVGDPKTCEQAATVASYVGCDYWPTVTSNPVAAEFKYAVVVSNVGEEPAHVTLTGPNGTAKEFDVAPASLETVELPWVAELKGGANGIVTSVLQRGGAFHLVSDRPVVVYQFNPLQYKLGSGFTERLSFTNDASLLLPSTAMTGTYRVMASYGMTASPRDRNTQQITGPATPTFPSFFAITATADDTTVHVTLGSKAKVIGGGEIASATPGGTLDFTLSAGDVAEIMTEKGADFDPSGSLITASKPVQVISGTSCINFPFDVLWCDHIEETVFPAETLGKRYVVARPVGPSSDVVPQYVRIYGNVNATTLTYKPSKPAGCPDRIDAGEVLECGVSVDSDFEVEGDHEFGVGLFLLGSTLVDPGVSTAQQKGDPSQSFAVTVPQFRERYVFLAPKDYEVNTITVVAPADTTLTLDGADKSSALAPLQGTEFFVARIRMDAGGNGSHTLEASNPVGLQVTGYGRQTSYQYPGGLNLGKIAPPPVF